MSSLRVWIEPSLNAESLHALFVQFLPSVGILSLLAEEQYSQLCGVIGISVPGVSLSSKSVQLKGLNNLANGVVIDSFDLPENDPDGGIHLTIQSTVTNVRVAIMRRDFAAEGPPIALASRVLVILYRLPSILRRHKPRSRGVDGLHSRIRVDDIASIGWPSDPTRFRVRTGRRIYRIQQLRSWHE